MPRIKFEVTGKVQGVSPNTQDNPNLKGVFFRVHAVKKATSLGVTGWIRNTKTESVEGEAQHKEAPKLEDFLKWLKYEGPPDAKIDQVKIEKIPEVEGETEFKKIKNYQR